MQIAGAILPRKGQRVRVSDSRSIWLYPPSGASPGLRPLLFWIHGGGLVFGHPVQEDAFCHEVATRLGIIVAAPDYRFAPAHPYPAALDDVHAALGTILERPEVDAEQFVIGGDSAGGGLAACLAIRLRDEGGPRPCLQLLHEPMLDEATRFRADPDPNSLRIWSANANRLSWNGYLAGIGASIPATASAARVETVTGLPPAWIGVGTADLFWPESQAYASRLKAGGVPVTLDIVDRAHHGFLTTEPKAAVSQLYRERMIAAIKSGLGLSSVPR